MSEKVNERFSKISRRYDFMNHFLSMGADIRWRAAAADEAMLEKDKYSVLDLGTGTGDLAIAINGLAETKGKRVAIEATDFNTNMLRLAKEKAKKMGIKEIRFGYADALNLKYKNESFEVVTSAFLLRSLDDLNVFLSEARRVLKKGGKLILLDMAKPDEKSERRFFSVYSCFIRLASILSSVEAYNWLVDSINRFDKKDLLRRVRAKGFKKVAIRSLPMGIAFIATCEK